MDTCRSCGTEMRAEARYCPRCGRGRTDAGVPDPDPQVVYPPSIDSGRDPSVRRTGPRTTVVAAAVVAVLAVVTSVLALRPTDTGAEPTAPELPSAAAASAPVTTASEPAAGRPSVVAAVASCVAPGSRDAGGTPTSYEAARAVDGDPSTAWRCQGDGSGQRLRLTFDGTVELHSIGLIPGLAKSDPVDGSDRYAQNRRLSAVRYDFDDGTSVVQRCDTSGSRRSVQSVALPAVRTSSVTVTIVSSVPGSTQAAQAAVDTVAISEVVVA